VELDGVKVMCLAVGMMVVVNPKLFLRFVLKRVNEGFVDAKQKERPSGRP
jgi:hypothetical protein